MEGRCLMDPPFEQIIEEILSEKVVKKVSRRDWFFMIFWTFCAKPSRRDRLSKTLERICPSDFFDNLSRNRFLLEGFVALLWFFALEASGEHLGASGDSLVKSGQALGGFGEPRWSPDGPRWSQDGPRWSQDGPRWSQDGPRCGPDEPRRKQTAEQKEVYTP